MKQMRLDLKLAHLKIDLLKIRIFRIGKSFNPEKFYKDLNDSINWRAKVLSNEKD